MGPLAIFIAVVLLLLAAEILFETVAVRLSLPIFEHRPPISAELFPADPSAESVAIRTRDGLALAGSWLRTDQDSPRGVVLFCHELDSNRWSALAYCEGLLAAGFHVFTFDFRNHGDSQSLAGYSPMHWATAYEIEDIRAAAACIAAHPELRHLPLGIFGMSRGASAALVAAAECSAIHCVVADGALACVEMQNHYTERWGRLYFPDFVFHLMPEWHKRLTLWLVRTASALRKGVRYVIAERAAAKLRRKPVLIISGARDTYVNPEITRRLQACTGQPAANLWIVPDAKHNMSRQTCPQEYDARLVEFFAVLDPARGATPVAAGRVAAGSAPARSLAASPTFFSSN